MAKEGMKGCLRMLYGTMSLSDLSQLLGVSVRTVQTWADDMGLRTTVGRKKPVKAGKADKFIRRKREASDT